MKLKSLETAASGHGKIGPLTIDIQAGTILGITGPSGAGKTTLLRAIASSSQGNRFRVAGEIGDIRGRMAYSPQAHCLPQGVTAGYFIEQLAGSAGWTDAAKPLSLHNVENVQCQVLSGGQAQRVMLAACIASDPSYCLLDEPFSALDYPMKIDSARFLRDWINGGREKSAVVVSHDLDILLTISDHLLVVGNSAHRAEHLMLNTAEIGWHPDAQLLLSTKDRILNFLHGLQATP